jgi:hypothetical protein
MMARTGFLFFNILFMLMLLAWPVLSLVALFMLRRKAVKETARAVWALVITAVPVMGALAFFIVGSQPQAEPTQAEQ